MRLISMQIYCNRNVWGSALGKGGEGEDEEIIARLNKVGREEEIRYDEIMYYFGPSVLPRAFFLRIIC